MILRPVTHEASTGGVEARELVSNIFMMCCGVSRPQLMVFLYQLHG
jgi:hypothetical protein